MVVLKDRVVAPLISPNEMSRGPVSRRRLVPYLPSRFQARDYPLFSHCSHKHCSLSVTSVLVQVSGFGLAFTMNIDPRAQGI